MSMNKADRDTLESPLKDTAHKGVKKQGSDLPTITHQFSGSRGRAVAEKQISDLWILRLTHVRVLNQGSRFT